MSDTDPRSYILELIEWEESNGYKTVDLIMEWSNGHDISIDSVGDVWIGGPGTGSWLSTKSLSEFVEWHKQQVA